jgi:hypothetical protein
MIVSNISMREKPFFGPDIYFEPGYWTYTTIPEPSAGALLTIGLIAFGWKKLKARQH